PALRLQHHHDGRIDQQEEVRVGVPEIDEEEAHGRHNRLPFRADLAISWQAMSKIGQIGEISPAPLRAFAARYPAGWRTGSHSHGRTQLVFAAAGVVTVATAGGSWTVPPQRAV